ncbi:hypothetical protein ACIG0C_31920 [Kitasatospora aureofaciens]|uniref:hypothetical protein n=1 Tax=Kitasatospora aureofaciens TaxID=1894 RepID=UPI000ADFF5CE|nr:hypothetical protein [Kitasatospora aureofaciens]UKZ07385.1 hypothetical protein BOQ63_025795 [Streptomyces viridifaciens]
MTGIRVISGPDRFPLRAPSFSLTKTIQPGPNQESSTAHAQLAHGLVGTEAPGKSVDVAGPSESGVRRHRLNA